jgi:RHS repeat-associated protein
MLDGLGLDQIFAQTTSNGTSSFLTDGINSTTALTNGSGAVATSYTYSPYGDSANSAGSTTTQFQFTGRENDGATGLYYLRARYYSPQMGRFISEDPIGFSSGANFYAYANGNPIGSRDPLGLFTLQVGLTLNFQFGFINLNGTYGLVVDGYGDVGTYVVGGVAGGVGAGGFGGINVAVSSGDCIQDIGGPFYNQSVIVGAGFAGGLDSFAGQGSHGQPVIGGGFSLGIGAGADYSFGGSDTKVSPIL